MEQVRRVWWLSVWTAVAVLILGVAAFAQMPAECVVTGPGNVVNPTRVCFEVSPDHDALDRYDLDLIDPAGGIVNTINMGVPVPVETEDGSRWVNWPNLNVMPTMFGVGYHAVLRAVANLASSPDSDDSNLWDRAPGRPGGALRVVE